MLREKYLSESDWQMRHISLHKCIFAVQWQEYNKIKNKADHFLINWTILNIQQLSFFTDFTIY